MAQLIINSYDDISSIDTVIEGSMEVLSDDGAEDSPMYSDWEDIWDVLREHVCTAPGVYTGVYPVIIEMDRFSGEQTTMMHNLMEDCAQAFDEFTAVIK